MSAGLPATAASLPGLAVLLDPARLGELFADVLGAPPVTGALRYKPGVSAVVRVRCPRTGAVHWAATTASEALLEKFAGRGRRALDDDGAVLVREAPGAAGHRVALGRAGADPELAVHLARLDPRLARGLGRGEPGTLLRYNPRRRAVLRREGPGSALVTKVTARPSPVDTRLLARLAAAGIPVLAPADPPRPLAGPGSAHVLHYPWYGDGDLGARTGGDPGAPGTAGAAGAALARLHLLGPGAAGTAPRGAPVEPRPRLRALAADLSALDPTLAAAFAAAAEDVLAVLDAHGPGTQRLLHGDFSADQVLVRGPLGAAAPLRLTDLDRVRTGEAADDLGCFAAVRALEALEGPVPDATAGGPAPAARADPTADPLADPLVAALLEGWAAEAAPHGARPPGPELLRAWTAHHVLARAAEPFRATHPGWRAATAGRIALAAALVAAPARAPAATGAARAPGPGGVPAGARATGSAPATAVLRGAATASAPAGAGGPAAGAAAARGEARSWPGTVGGPGPGPGPGSSPAGAAEALPHPVPAVVEVPEGGRARVRRAWPADGGRLVLELEDPLGRIRAGESVPGPAGRLVRLSPFARDPRLPGLPAAARTGELVVHRLGRRAVVAAPERYVKLLARGRAPRAAELSERVRVLGAAAGLAVPRVLRAGEHALELAVLPGRSLHALGAEGPRGAVDAAWAAWAAVWPRLARALPAPGLLPEHTAEDEARTLARWAAHLDAFPGLLDAPPGAVSALAVRLGQRLTGLPAPRRDRAVLHRDLHDQQLLFDGERIGALDLDTAAVGEPTLDLANLAVHLDLRHAQGLLGPERHAAGRAAVAAVADELAVDPARLAVHADATRLRLACVYAFRPRWRPLAQQLLDAALADGPLDPVRPGDR
ncbi:hypothetical protein [Kocuria flava]|uniref:hypothetical protein n=1 Tax=Kocuria flava TaxID=446860 RepID=UPI002F92C2CE